VTVRALIVDPSAYTRPYDAALCAALARRGAQVRLVTSRFDYGEVPEPDGYAISHLFYRRARGGPGSAGRRVGKLAGHVDDMRALRALAARAAVDVTHFQWTTVPWVDGALLPAGPVVLTVHNPFPRFRRPGQARAQQAVYDRVDALVVHSAHGRDTLVARRGVDPGKVHVIPIGATPPDSDPANPLPPELAAVDDGRPVVLLFGLLRPYKGVRTLLQAWRGIEGAQLWIVGRPMMELPPLPDGVMLVPRYVSNAEADALYRRADVITLPYEDDERIDQSGVMSHALGAGRAIVCSTVGGLAEVADAGAVRGVAPGDAQQLRDALAQLVTDPAARDALAAAARTAADGPYSWDAVAQRTLALYGVIRR
jgi:glycosyltransferase involved in cell wall biosynthesis